MRKWLGAGVVALVMTMGAPRATEAQTRADTAAVLLEAAERLRLRGETGAARAVLDLIAREYAGTPAAAQVGAMRGALQRMRDPERSGRTSLLVFGAAYGAWLGVAAPIIGEADSPTPYGLGLLLGAPAGFLAARAYANGRMPSEGQANAITFGGLWGTAQGMAWAEVLEWGGRTESYPVCIPDSPCEDVVYETGPDGEAVVAAGVIGGLAGIATGALLARKPISAGTAATVTLSGLWGAWFGYTLGYVGGADDDALLAAGLISGNAALLASGLAAPRWDLSRSRARLISVGGLVGALTGAGLLLLVQPDDDRTAVLFPTIGSAVGLGAAAYWTRGENDGLPPDPMPGEAGALPGALLNLSDGTWSLDMPAATVRLQRNDGSLRPAAYVPLLSAQFR